MKALIVYHSKHGKTKRFAENIGKYINKLSGSVVVKSIDNTSIDDINACDLLVLGCWTSGKWLFGQKPEQAWIDFAQRLPKVENKETVLFTTYWLTTGSMFRNMKNLLLPKGYKILSSIKSRNAEMDYYSVTALRYAYKYRMAA